MERKSKPGLVLVVTGAFITLTGLVSFYRHPDTKMIMNLLPAPTPYMFKVAATGQQWRPFGNNLPIGSWIVSVPGDNRVHESPIPVSDKRMLLVNFVKGKSGRATFLVKERAWDIRGELAETSWYETNFYKSGKTDEWNTRIKADQYLKFRARDDVELRVEIYKR